jgi:hypothetical protein
MPRHPIGKKAMSPAERQRRRRKKLAKQALARMSNSERLEKQARTYIPMPPGITYWVRVLTSWLNLRIYKRGQYIFPRLSFDGNVRLTFETRRQRWDELIMSQMEDTIYLCDVFMSLASQAARLADIEVVEVASVPKSKRARPRLPVPDHAAKKAVLMNLPREMYLQLDALAVHDGTSLTDVMRRATSDYLAMRMFPTKFF